MSSFDDADAWGPFAEQEPIDTQVVDFLEEAELSYPLQVLEGTAAADVSLSPVRQALPVAVAVDQATSPSVTLEKPELPTCSPPPRKRLRGKQPPPELARPAPRVSCDPEALSFTDEKSATGQRWADLIKGFDDMEWRMKWRMVHRRFVWWLGVQRQRLADKPEPTATEQHVVMVSQGNWKTARRELKHDVMALFMSVTGAPTNILEFYQEAWPSGPKQVSAYLYSRTVLFTWHGEWGVVAVPRERVDRCFNGESRSPAGVEELCRELSMTPDVNRLWHEFEEHIDKVQVVLQSEEH